MLTADQLLQDIQQHGELIQLEMLIDDVPPVSIVPENGPGFIAQIQEHVGQLPPTSQFNHHASGVGVDNNQGVDSLIQNPPSFNLTNDGPG